MSVIHNNINRSCIDIVFTSIIFQALGTILLCVHAIIYFMPHDFDKLLFQTLFFIFFPPGFFKSRFELLEFS